MAGGSWSGPKSFKRRTNDPDIDLWHRFLGPNAPAELRPSPSPTGTRLKTAPFREARDLRSQCRSSPTTGSKHRCNTPPPCNQPWMAARQAAADAGLGAQCRNPFRSIVVRAVEVVYAIEAPRGRSLGLVPGSRSWSRRAWEMTAIQAGSDGGCPATKPTPGWCLARNGAASGVRAWRSTRPDTGSASRGPTPRCQGLKTPQ